MAPTGLSNLTPASMQGQAAPLTVLFTPLAVPRGLAKPGCLSAALLPDLLHGKHISTCKYSVCRHSITHHLLHGIATSYHQAIAKQPSLASVNTCHSQQLASSILRKRAGLVNQTA